MILKYILFYFKESHFVTLPCLESTIDQTGLEFRDLPTFTYLVLGLKVPATLPISMCVDVCLYVCLMLTEDRTEHWINLLKLEF